MAPKIILFTGFPGYHLSPVHLFMPQSFPQDSICQLHLTMVPTLRKAAAVSTMHEAKGPPTPLFAGTGRAEHARAMSNPGWVGDDFQEMSGISLPACWKSTYFCVTIAQPQLVCNECLCVSGCVCIRKLMGETGESWVLCVPWS